jgi:hypothetical protein
LRHVVVFVVGYKNVLKTYTYVLYDTQLLKVGENIGFVVPTFAASFV